MIMNNRKYLTLYLLLTITSLVSVAQVRELVPNGTFEGGGPPSCIYHSAGDYHLDNWVTASGTFDWFDENYRITSGCTTFNTLTMPTVVSNRWIGMYGNPGGTTNQSGTVSEAILVNLTDKIRSINNHKTYHLKLKASCSFFGPPTCDPKFKVHFTKWAISYDNQGDLVSDWKANPLWTGNVQYLNAASFTISRNDVGSWVNYEAYITLTDVSKDNILQNLVIETDASNGSSYIFIDDVSLQEVDYCNHHCTPSNAVSTITMGPIPNAMSQGTPYRFFLVVGNVQELHFTVWDRWGNDFFHYNCFDVNTLKDPGYQDFAIQWDGINDLGNWVQVDEYVVELELKNCTDYYHSLNNVAILGQSGSWPTIYPEVVNYQLANCCPDHSYYQNTNLTGIFNDNENNFIEAGTSVTSGPTGPVTVMNGANIGFYAGNYINLANGFSVQNGATFAAVIRSCVGQRGTPAGDTRVKRPLLTSNELSQTSDVTAFPNPTNGVFTLKSLAPLKNVSVEITDVLGRSLLNKNKELLQSEQFDISALKSGIYYIKIRNNEGQCESLKIVKE
jgi:hypothetical protein